MMNMKVNITKSNKKANKDQIEQDSTTKKAKKYKPDVYGFGATFLLILIVFAIFIIPYAIIDRATDNINDVVCKEKYLGNDLGEGVISFRFIRKSDNKEFIYDMYESKDNKTAFDKLNSKIKKGTNCQIVTDGSDNVKEVKIPIND